MNRSEPINRSRLQEYSGGEIEFEQELLNLFMVDAQQHLDAIDVAIASATDRPEKSATRSLSEENTVVNLDIIYQEAHHLKGASGSIGAERFQKLAAQLEQATRQGQPYLSKLSELKIAFAELATKISQWPN
ncbi:MAG: Hpt domain-containing protein [Thermosynechococcaceae cyanobacterium]